jgi:addiction module HigA family antidote
MATKKLRAVHPGDILRHNFIEPLGLSAHELAKDLGVTVLTVNEIVRRRRAVTGEMALRLSRYFGTTEQLWQNLQSQLTDGWCGRPSVSQYAGVTAWDPERFPSQWLS